MTVAVVTTSPSVGRFLAPFSENTTILAGMCVVARTRAGLAGEALAQWAAPATVAAGRSARYARLLQRSSASGRTAARFLRRRLVAGTLADLVRRRPALLAENALLRQQRIIVRRGAKRPRCTPAERSLLVVLASRRPTGGTQW